MLFPAKLMVDQGDADTTLYLKSGNFHKISPGPSLPKRGICPSLWQREDGRDFIKIKYPFMCGHRENSVPHPTALQEGNF